MKISAAGLSLLKAYESLSLTIYPDQAGKPTIGYGHLIRAREDFSGGIDAAQAEHLLTEDCGWAEGCVNAWAASKMTLLQREFDALTCFTFNVGALAFEGSTLRRKLLADDMAGAADQFLSWDKVHDAKTGRLVESAGLLKRRTAEQALFLGKPWSPP